MREGQRTTAQKTINDRRLAVVGEVKDGWQAKHDREWAKEDGQEMEDNMISGSILVLSLSRQAATDNMQNCKQNQATKK